MTETITDYHTIPSEWLEKYTESLEKHISAVQEAGNRLGVPFAQLKQHDASKWSMEELPYYARQFFGDKGDPQGFAMAWLHHQNFNPHHWEHYITRSDHSNGASGAEDGCLPMPKKYALEMIADWLGASYVYTGSWNMDSWLAKNWEKIRLHSTTRNYVEKVLEEIKEQKLFEN